MNVKKQTAAFRHWKLWLWLPMCMAVGLACAMFWGVGALYWGPVDSDLRNQFFPWHVFVHRWFSRGIMPWWDPHVFCGYPSLETQQMLALNPIHLISLLLPANWGLPLQMAAHTIISTAGMAWGLNRWGRCPRMAAAVGSAVWTFGALFSVRVTAGHITVVAGIAWWPLAVLSVLRMVRSVKPSEGSLAGARLWESLRGVVTALRENRRLRYLVGISAFAHGMVCLAGGPQYIIYLFYMDLAVLVACARRSAWTGALALLAVVWMLAVILAAPQWLPALWYLPYSSRALGGSGATGLNFGPLLNIWLEGIMPYPFGDDIHTGHLHFKNVWETATYPGSLSLVLSIAVIIRTTLWTGARAARRGMRIPVVSPVGVAGVLIFLAGLYMMIGGWLPGFGGFREATKARAVAAFGIALMSAAGFTQLIRTAAPRRRAAFTGSILMGIAICSAIGYGNTDDFRSLLKYFGPPMDPMAGDSYLMAMENPAAAVARYLSATWWALGAISLGAVGLLALKRWPRPVSAFLLAVTVIDPFAAHAPNWLARHPWAEAGLPKPIADFFAPKLAASSKAGELPWRVILHSSIINRTHHMEGLYEYHGYDPLMPARAVNRLLLKGLNRVSDDEKFALRPRLLEPAGVRYDARNWVPGTEDLATSLPQVEVVPNNSLFGISRNVVARSPGLEIFGPSLDGTHYVMPAAQGGIVDKATDPPEDFAAHIKGKLSGKGADDLSSAGEHLAPISTHRPDEFGVKANLKSPALLIFKATWLPGWHVWVDGLDTGRALFADNWMCGTIIEAGQHEVIFRYRPVGWWSSLLLSACAALVLGGLLFYRQGSKPRTITGSKPRNHA